MNLIFRADPVIKLCIGDKAPLTSSIAQTDVFTVRGERYLCGVFVVDVGIESGHEHQGFFEMFLDALVVRFDSHGAAQRKRVADVSQEFGGNQDIVKDHRFVNVQLKVSLRAGERDRMVISEDLEGDHGQGLALRRIDFSTKLAANRLNEAAVRKRELVTQVVMIATHMSRNRLDAKKGRSVWSRSRGPNRLRWGR